MPCIGESGRVPDLIRTGLFKFKYLFNRALRSVGRTCADVVCVVFGVSLSLPARAREHGSITKLLRMSRSCHCEPGPRRVPRRGVGHCIWTCQHQPIIIARIIGSL